MLMETNEVPSTPNCKALVYAAKTPRRTTLQSEELWMNKD